MMNHRVLRWPAPALLILALFTGNATARVKVAFLAPDPPGTHPFWTQTIEVMRAAADDLDIELQIAHSKSNTYSNRKDGRALLDDNDKPDYFLTGYWTGGTNTLLEYAEQRGIKTMVFNSGVDAGDKDNVGVPRGRFNHWIGQMTPDDELTGYVLADMLITRTRAKHDGGPVHVIGLGGYVDISSNDYRQAGLNRRIAEDPKAVLDTYFHAEWSETIAYRLLRESLKPQTPISIIWSSGDTMALGAVRAARDINKTPGENMFIGGFGWLPPALKAVADGDIEVTLGGHFLEGAWALILVHDHYHGRDFAGDLGVRFQTQYQPVTADNAQTYLDMLADADWSTVDFRQFSKVHNPELETYQWPLAEVLDQLDNAKPRSP